MSTLFLVDFHWISRVNVFPYVKMINDDAEEGGISNGILTSCQPLKVASGREEGDENEEDEDEDDDWED